MTTQDQGVVEAIAEALEQREPDSYDFGLWAKPVLDYLTAKGFTLVRTEDIERISATWGPSLDQAAPVDLRIHERLREALGQKGETDASDRV